ncbi:MAG: hypothetical protein ACK4Y4_03860 [Brevundimonas sp.]
MSAPGPIPDPGPSPRRKGPGTRARVSLTLLGAAVLAAVSVAAMGWAWDAIGASPMTLHGWIALSIGAVGTALLTAGLMTLAFHSHSSGHDDRVEPTEGINERIRRRF